MSFLSTMCPYKLLFTPCTSVVRIIRAIHHENYYLKTAPLVAFLEHTALRQHIYFIIVNWLRVTFLKWAFEEMGQRTRVLVTTAKTYFSVFFLPYIDSHFLNVSYMTFSCKYRRIRSDFLHLLSKNHTESLM